MPGGIVTIRVVIRNKKALRAFSHVVEYLYELAEEVPWRDEPKKAIKLLKYAAKHMLAEPYEEEDGE